MDSREDRLICSNSAILEDIMKEISAFEDSIAVSCYIYTY